MKNVTKYLLSVIIVLLFICCNTTKKICQSKIYYEIYNCHGFDVNLDDNVNKSNYRGITPWYFNQLTKTDFLSEFGRLNENDTIFLLEKNGIQGNFMFTAWSKNKILSFDNQSENLKLVKYKESMFSKYMRELVSHWNIAEIRKEGLENPPLPQEEILATRIIFNKGKYQIDCFSFLDFFNLKRDWQY